MDDLTPPFPLSVNDHTPPSLLSVNGEGGVCDPANATVTPSPLAERGPGGEVL